MLAGANIGQEQSAESTYPRQGESGYGWLPKFSGDFHVQKCIYGEIFVTIRSVFLEIRAKLQKTLYLAVLKNSF